MAEGGRMSTLSIHWWVMTHKNVLKLTIYGIYFSSKVGGGCWLPWLRPHYLMGQGAYE